MATKEQAIEMLETIIDPEVGIDISTMGLIYNIDIPNEKTIHILMTFTSPLCPAGEQIKEEVEESMKLLKFENVTVNVTFEPPWKPPQALREALGI